MANLSNINNKFLVTTGGNVLIGQTSAVGSSIFQVTGNSTFTGQVEVALASNQIKLSTGTAGDGYLNIGHFSNGTFIGTYGDDGGAADLLRFGVHSGDVALTINSDKSATFTGNVEIDGNLTVDGSIIHGGGGAGIFTGSKTINSSTAATAFTLQRSTGTLIFDVWLTSETSTATSVAKKYTVAHSYGTDPVYNKIIDTGPDGSNDFTVTFVNAGTGGNSVNCSIISNTIAAQAIGYTVQVGHDGTNALTFTAG